jgi:hypothetical protein
MYVGFTFLAFMAEIRYNRKVILQRRLKPSLCQLADEQLPGSLAAIAEMDIPRYGTYMSFMCFTLHVSLWHNLPP